MARNEKKSAQEFVDIRNFGISRGNLTPLRFTLKSVPFTTYYFIAARRALRRDLYRPAVFLWITPVFTALSIIETVPEKAALAWAASLDSRALRKFRNAVRRRE